MSAVETGIIEQIRSLPEERKRDLVEHIWAEFSEGYADEVLTPAQMAELDRRAEEALKYPERGKPAEQVFAEIENRLRAKK